MDVATPVEAILPARTAAEELQGYCDLFGHPKATIWDRYDAGDRRALVHKLKIIYGISEELVDDGGTNNGAVAVDPFVGLNGIVWSCIAY